MDFYSLQVAFLFWKKKEDNILKEPSPKKYFSKAAKVGCFPLHIFLVPHRVLLNYPQSFSRRPIPRERHLFFSVSLSLYLIEFKFDYVDLFLSSICQIELKNRLEMVSVNLSGRC